MHEELGKKIGVHCLPGYLIVLLDGQMLGVGELRSSHGLVDRCIAEHELSLEQIDRLDVRNVTLAMQEPGFDYLDEDPMELIHIVYGGPGLPHGMKLAIADEGYGVRETTGAWPC